MQLLTPHFGSTSKITLGTINLWNSNKFWHSFWPIGPSGPWGLVILGLSCATSIQYTWASYIPSECQRLPLKHIFESAAIHPIPYRTRANHEFSHLTWNFRYCSTTSRISSWDFNTWLESLNLLLSSPSSPISLSCLLSEKLAVTSTSPAILKFLDCSSGSSW